MTELSFTKVDEQKFIEFLNVVAKHATFNLNTQELINYYHLLVYIKNTFAPKISANILEVVKIVEAEKEPAKEQAPKVEASKKKG